MLLLLCHTFVKIPLYIVSLSKWVFIQLYVAKWSNHSNNQSKVIIKIEKLLLNLFKISYIFNTWQKLTNVLYLNLGPLPSLNYFFSMTTW